MNSNIGVLIDMEEVDKFVFAMKTFDIVEAKRLFHSIDWNPSLVKYNRSEANKAIRELQEQQVDVCLEFSRKVYLLDTGITVFPEDHIVFGHHAGLEFREIELAMNAPLETSVISPDFPSWKNYQLRLCSFLRHLKGIGDVNHPVHKHILNLIHNRPLTLDSDVTEYFAPHMRKGRINFIIQSRHWRALMKRSLRILGHLMPKLEIDMDSFVNVVLKRGCINSLCPFSLFEKIKREQRIAHDGYTSQLNVILKYYDLPIGGDKMVFM